MMIRRMQSPSNVPGARFGAIGWRDKDEIFWIFGSGGYDESSYGIVKHSEI
jgi:hypothetical protein